MSHQYDPFYPQLITSSHHTPHIIHPLLYHEPHTTIQQHYTHPPPFLHHLFPISHILPFPFSPTIKTIHNTKIYTIHKPAYYPHL
ncbi:Tn3 family transposase, partial [Bacillus thuringiensis]|uniref:Tn3 family transposase n=1 Tax=Bacillus thuringiensis TaxID=1428 RepID=UPI0021B48288